MNINGFLGWIISSLVFTRLGMEDISPLMSNEIVCACLCECVGVYGTKGIKLFYFLLSFVSFSFA